MIFFVKVATYFNGLLFVQNICKWRLVNV